MCGMGTFMVRRKEKKSAACPRCSTFEDAAHIWTCQGDCAPELWKTSLNHLKQWLQANGTDLDLQKVIVTYLNRYSYGSNTNLSIPYGLKQLIGQQKTILWRPFLEGLTGLEREVTQQAYYDLTRSRKLGKR